MPLLEQNSTGKSDDPLTKWCRMENDNRVRKSLKEPLGLPRNLFIDAVKEAFTKKSCLSWLFNENYVFDLTDEYRIAFHLDNIFEAPDYNSEDAAEIDFDKENGIPAAARHWLAPANEDQEPTSEQSGEVLPRDLFALKPIENSDGVILLGQQLGYIEVKFKEDSEEGRSATNNGQWTPTGIIVFLKLDPDTSKSEGLFYIDSATISNFKKGKAERQVMQGLWQLVHEHGKVDVEGESRFEACRVFMDDDKLWMD